ncbi:MAG: thioredoxin family protein [Rikenellaceae bacterium]|jgi:thiol-disulfide isomerase/thioredoxin|nr:thioredoxin family protein [Rikenellaceae bacterium]
MKNLIRLSVLVLSLLAAGNLQAQRLMIGEKAPDVKIAKWIGGSQPSGGKAQLVDFFHSTNDQCVASLSKLDALARQYSGKINFVIVGREDESKLSPLAVGKNYAFFFGLDDNGKTFTAYNVRFVPFSVLLDNRGQVVWMGNPSGLTDAILDDAVK